MNQKMFSTSTRVLIIKCGKHPKESVKDIWERIKVFGNHWCSESLFEKAKKTSRKRKKITPVQVLY